MEEGVAIIGFGEAGRAFSGVGSAPARVYDIKVASAATRDAIHADYARYAVAGHDSAAGALAGAHAVLSLVTADQALEAARLYSALLPTDALWFDMNSVASGTKRDAAGVVEAAGGRYVDVAVMSPVNPQWRGVPLLVSGPHADAGASALGAMGFTNIRVVGDKIGAASAIKMIRSVMIKGFEALTAECVLAAEAAGVRAEVLASLDASWPDAEWATKADYNLDRMMVHGVRRAAEMNEVVETLEALGTGSEMSRATARWQQAIGELRLAPPLGLDAKLEVLRPFNGLARECAA